MSTPRSLLQRKSPAPRLALLAMLALAAACLPAGARKPPAQGSETVGPPPASPQWSTEYLREMEHHARSIHLSRLENGEPTPVALLPGPLDHYAAMPGAPNGEGTVWAWGARAGRPVALVNVVFSTPPGNQRLWSYELLALAEGGVVAEGFEGWKWAPQQPGLELKRLPDAPAPADSAPGRLPQMKKLARRFQASERLTAGQPPLELALSPQPLVRYADPETGLLDGALFSFVSLGKPEILLVLEARRRDSEAPAWQYGLARFSTSEQLSVSLDDEEVWKQTQALSGAREAYWNHPIPRPGPLPTRVTLHGQKGPVRFVVYSPDGDNLVTGGDDQEVRLWRGAGRFLRTGVVARLGEEVIGVAFSPDGKTLAAGGTDRTVTLWDVAAGRGRATLSGHTQDVRSLAFSPDGKILASVGGTWGRRELPGEVKLWEVAGGKELPTFPRPPGMIFEVAFSPDGKTLAGACHDGTVKLWDWAGGKLRAVLAGHRGPVSGVRFSPDGHTLFSGSWDQTVKIWDLPTGKELATLDTGQSQGVMGIALSPDGKTLAVTSSLADGTTLGTVQLWEVATRRRRGVLQGARGYLNRLAFSPDGQTLAAAGGIWTEFGEIQVWDLATGDRRLTVQARNNELVETVAFSPDGQTLAGVGGIRDMGFRGEVGTGEVRLWRMAAVQTTSRLTGPKGAVWCGAMSPDGKVLATGSEDHTIRLWDMNTGKEMATFAGHTGAVLSVAFSPDGRMLASGGADQKAKLWDLGTTKERGTLEGHRGAVHSVAFSPDGQTLASGSADQTVKLWDIVKRSERATLQGHRGAVRALAYSPDGKTLATASADHTAKLWDAATGAEQATLQGHGNEVWSVAFSPQGESLATGGLDRTVKLWDRVTGRLQLTLSDHGAGVTGVAFSPDGKQLVSASEDHTVKLWVRPFGQVFP